MDPVSKSPAIILLSGGIDSAVAGATYRHLYDLTAITIEYGQPSIEKMAAILISDWLGCKKILCRIQGWSALADDPTNYFPARNLLFLSLALKECEIRGIRTIIIGANADDQRDYPDCRPDFFRAFENMARAGTRTNIAILSPLLNMTKTEVVAQAIHLSVPLHKTISCYKPRDRTPCGQCAACNLRRTAYEANGLEFKLERLDVDFGESKPWLDREIA